jgi:DNA-binding MarR family transcriptional regulator
MANKEIACFPIWFGKIRKAVQRRQTELLKPYGLSSIHAMYLVALVHCEEGMTLRELCEKLFVDKANTSRAIAALEEQNYIEKKFLSTSKQKYRICLTDMGNQIAKEVVENMKQAHDILLGSLTTEELQTVKNVMEKIHKAADDI